MAEKEYIERKATIETLKDNVTEMESDIYYGSNKGVPKDDIEDIVNEIPVADVIEVVRCKDCKYWKEEDFGMFCSHWASMLTESQAYDYCSHGERKEE